MSFLFYPLALLMSAVLIFWLIEKVLILANYGHNCEHDRLRNKLLQEECDLKHETTMLRRAQIVALFRDRIFNAEELAEIDKRGLSSYLSGK